MGTGRRVRRPFNILPNNSANWNRIRANPPPLRRKHQSTEAEIQQEEESMSIPLAIYNTIAGYSSCWVELITHYAYHISQPHTPQFKPSTIVTHRYLPNSPSHPYSYQIQTNKPPYHPPVVHTYIHAYIHAKPSKSKPAIPPKKTPRGHTKIIEPSTLLSLKHKTT